MSVFSSRLGLAFVLAVLCLGGRTAHAQAAPVTYWTPGWPAGFGGNLTGGQSSNTYGNFPGFDGSDARGGGVSNMRYNFPNGWFVGAEGGGMGLSMNGINQDGAFGNIPSLYYQGVQFGYNFKNAGGLPLTVYAGFDTLKYNAGIGGPFAPFNSMSGTLPGYSAHAGVSACHSGSATPNSRGASIATSIRSRCPALLRLPSAVAANARFSRGSWDKRAAAPRGVAGRNRFASSWHRSAHNMRRNQNDRFWYKPDIAATSVNVSFRGAGSTGRWPFLSLAAVAKW